MSWFWRGVLAGVRTERLGSGDVPAGLSPGVPERTSFSTEIEALEAAAPCPTGALEPSDRIVEVNVDRCVDCMRCASTQDWRHDVRWLHAGGNNTGPLDGGFKKSIHVRIVDAGDCGVCLNELAQLNGPSYNLHRFGIFITPTPRQADVLLVVGPVTRQMTDALRIAFEAMPTPKRVVAVGACAASGGVFGPSVMSGGGAADVVPVDLVVPGCPPPPLAVVHALRAVCGQETWP